MEDLIVRYVELALAARAKGLPVDLAKICSDHPNLIPEVDKLLRLDDAIDFEPPEDPLLGKVLDERYELQRCIGVGAMGAVYVAKDRTLDRSVAVKLLQNGLFASKERHERFAREARVLASLRHPNIVNVFDHGSSSPGTHYIVMEHLVGVPLAQLSQQAEEDTAAGLHPLDSEWLLRNFEINVPGLSYLPQVVFWCSQVASALEEAHAAGVTHRDVKPTNIFIDQTGAAILLDFGIAAKAGDGSLTADGSTIGSPWYMAPEQVGNRAASTELVDVYGLCATLYHLVTLRPPYEGDYAEVIAQLATTDPAPPQSIRPELSRDLCAVLEKGMERDPSRRYASMKALGADLRALYAQLPVVARPITKIARWGRSIRRRPGPAAAVLALILAVGITIPVVSWSRDEAFALETAQRVQHKELFKAIAPSMAVEGSFAMRPKLDPVVREAYLSQLDTLIELLPSDLHSRLLRSALLLDAGRLDDSFQDMQWIADYEESPFQQAMLQRYREIDVTKPGVVGLTLDGLPEPVTDTDRAVLGFQLHRSRRYQDAGLVLAPATSLAARTIRLGVSYVLGSKSMRGALEPGVPPSRVLLDKFLAEVEQLDADRGGATARSLYLRGSARNLLEDWVNGIADLERSLKLCPDAFGTNFNLADALIGQGEYQRALQLLRKAQALRPQNQNAAYLIASVAVELSDYDGAMANLDVLPRTGHLIEAHAPDFWRGYVEANRAISLYGKRDFVAAEAAEARALGHYQAALKLVAPGTFDDQRIRGNIEMMKLSDTDPEARVTKLLQLLTANPKHVTYLEALQVALEHSELSKLEQVHKHLVAFFSSLAIKSKRESISTPK